MALLDQLRAAKPPWVYLVVLDRGEKPESLLAVPPGFVERTIDGRRGRTKRGLLAELARALEFPADSGRNWDALEEMLADLEWLPAKGYLLVVTNADLLLVEDADDYATFIDIVKSVAKEWATPGRGESARAAVAFHVCLVVAKGRADARADWRAPRLSAKRRA
jgi:hypothetical protein